MPTQTIFVEVFGPLAFVFLLWVAIGGARTALRYFRSRETPEQLEAARMAFLARLVHPNAAEVEKGIGAFLPQRLIEFYENQQTLQTERVEIRKPGTPAEAPSEWIESFLPMDMESQRFSIDLVKQGWGKGFCFATNGAANFYWIPASDTRQSDAPVFFASSDPPTNEKVCESLAEFLSWPRTPDPADE
jgi:SMI1/KNR4 family protein SUKH-1